MTEKDDCRDDLFRPLKMSKGKEKSVWTTQEIVDKFLEIDFECGSSLLSDAEKTWVCADKVKELKDEIALYFKHSIEIRGIDLLNIVDSVFGVQK